MKDNKYIWLAVIALIISVVGMIPLVGIFLLYFLLPLGFGIASLAMFKRSNRPTSTLVMSIVAIVLALCWTALFFVGISMFV